MKKKRTFISSIGQYVKFAATGVVNTAVDFATLNTLIFMYTMISGAAGLKYAWFVGFKTASFLAAVTNSWMMNRYWVFSGSEAKVKGSAGKARALFLGVSSFGFVLNIGASLAVFSVLGSMGIVNEVIRANVGAIAGTAITQVSNFAGYKFLIFKDRHESNIPVGYNTGLQRGGAHRSDLA